ncbi:MAG TPA: pentapeptide repeat-containing protein [Cyclobacteriaceae bacterium]|nr:pentapeptide repeat-containing protein [Cyclobacteriaceae bacterium]
MKKYIFLALIVCIATSVRAQQKVKASDIIAMINDGKPVSFKDVVIEGELDLTNLKNRETHHSQWSDDDVIKSTVNTSLQFVNCTFVNDVLAYYHWQYEDETYAADFNGDVTFKHCKFEAKSEFKYSEFARQADFSECVFSEPANFKYANFFTGANFSKAVFKDEADFKYAKFPEGSSLEGAQFDGRANFKYTKFKTPLYVKNISFNGSRDFKYSRVGGKPFSDFLWDER